MTCGAPGCSNKARRRFCSELCRRRVRDRRRSDPEWRRASTERAIRDRLQFERQERRQRVPSEPSRFAGIDVELEPGPMGTGAAAECMDAEGSVL